MDLTPPAAAIAPFAASEATLRRAARRGEFPEGVAVRACIRRGAAPEAVARGGQEGGASSWSVAIPCPMLPEGLRPAPGMTVDPGPDWPRLFVRRAARLGNAWHLDCSGDERGAANG